jgi:hypothetical protein
MELSPCPSKSPDQLLPAWSVGHLAAVRATWRLHMAIQEKSIMGPRVRVFDAAVFQFRNLPLDPVLSDLARNAEANNKSE